MTVTTRTEAGVQADSSVAFKVTIALRALTSPYC